MSRSQHCSERLSRRHLLAGAAGVAATAPFAAPRAIAEPLKPERALNGRIKQSLVHWCYAKAWNPEQMAQAAVQLGCKSIELISPNHWPILKKYGLTCAIASCGTSFTKGYNHLENHPELIEKTGQAIDAAADFGTKSVISFTGMSEGLPDDVGMDNCVAGYKKIIGKAEKKGVNLCLEMLNSRVDVTMKGHPDYQGDHTDYCIELIRRVGSPNMKLLFDIYHVQIMDGDVISRIRQYKDYIAHVHTAGVPGRNELDDNQEINYPPIMRALLEVGYTGYVGQEFIPTRDPMQGLRQAVALCDV